MEADSGVTPSAAQVLRENWHLLPEQGVALDMACGLGGNALYLAEKALETYAWDVSNVAIEKLDSLAKSQGLVVQSQVRDVINQPPPPKNGGHRRFGASAIQHPICTMAGPNPYSRRS